jgi:hypothetical protein
MYVRLAFLGALLAATFVFHVSGSTLLELRIARIVLVALFVVASARITHRRHTRPENASRPD